MVFEEVFKVKQLINKMDLVEFKTRWNQRSNDYKSLNSTERLKYMVMSIKILQAEVDLKRMINSIKEFSEHPEPEKALHYHLRANLWKFLDNFRYILLIEEINDADKLECIDLLDELAEIIVQDEELKNSCLRRLHKLLQQIRHVQNSNLVSDPDEQISQVYAQLEQRITKLIYALKPEDHYATPPSKDVLPSAVRKLIERYSSFSVARIAIEKSGVLSIIRLVTNHSLTELEQHQALLHKTLTDLEEQVLYNPVLNTTRNECAYALIVLLEIVKMHKGLPVLLLKILNLCAYIEFPLTEIDLERELKELKGRVTQISQKKLRPIIEDVLLKEPLYLANIPHIKTKCSWCFLEDQDNVLNIRDIRRVVTSSFDRIETAPGIPARDGEMTKSRLSEMVIETLGLLVNVEPSPHFLKIHSQETKQIKAAKHSPISSASSLEKLLDTQYTTFKNQLKFLKDSIEYYNGISEGFEA